MRDDQFESSESVETILLAWCKSFRPSAKICSPVRHSGDYTSQRLFQTSIQTSAGVWLLFWSPTMPLHPNHSQPIMSITFFNSSHRIMSVTRPILVKLPQNGLKLNSVRWDVISRSFITLCQDLNLFQMLQGKPCLFTYAQMRQNLKSRFFLSN